MHTDKNAAKTAFELPPVMPIGYDPNANTDSGVYLGILWIQILLCGGQYLSRL